MAGNIAIFVRLGRESGLVNCRKHEEMGLGNKDCGYYQKDIDPTLRKLAAAFILCKNGTKMESKFKGRREYLGKRNWPPRNSDQLWWHSSWPNHQI